MSTLRVAAVQMAPVLLDRERTLAKILARLEEAATGGAKLVAFPESVLPGYPTWLAETGGARFNDPLQKSIHARYLDQGVELPGPVLTALQEATRRLGVLAVVGVMERGTGHGRGTLWCTALTVHPDGTWCAHRKLMPTYEERLAWGIGDGHGLRVHSFEDWNVGALNCWENWMPAARLALYGQGEEIHVSLWPGAPALTADISRFTAREGRVFVVASAGILRASDVPEDMPGRDELLARTDVLHAGGSRIVAPDGTELASLDEAREGIVYADLGRELLLAERQNFDPAGHYSRPDVLQLQVDRTRRASVHYSEGEAD